MRRTLIAATLALAACSSGEPTVSTPSAANHSHGPAMSLAEHELDAATRAQLARLRNATAPYHDLLKADDAGWDTRVTGCMSDPAGGMGFHYADLSRFDATVDPMRPEILVYAPKRGGGLQLVAVEYAVPFDAWKGPGKPTAFGQEFHENFAFGLWVLHAWVWQPNPKGVFKDWNPRVTCP